MQKDEEDAEEEEAEEDIWAIFLRRRSGHLGRPSCCCFQGDEVKSITPTKPASIPIEKRNAM